MKLYHCPYFFFIRDWICHQNVSTVRTSLNDFVVCNLYFTSKLAVYFMVGFLRCEAGSLGIHLIVAESNLNEMIYSRIIPQYSISLLVFSFDQTFPEERRVFLRDNHSGMYRTDIYFLCKTFAQVSVRYVPDTTLIFIK